MPRRKVKTEAQQKADAAAAHDAVRAWLAAGGKVKRYTPDEAIAMQRARSKRDAEERKQPVPRRKAKKAADG